MELILLATSIFAGFLGALLGLGGGIIVVPVLTLFYHVNIRYAIAASLIAVVATSSGAAASYLKDALTNLRLAVFLELGTVTGAVVGFFLSGMIKSQYLFVIFGVFLLLSALMMLRRREETLSHNGHPWSHSLGLNASYKESAEAPPVSYEVENVPLGLLAMFGAGILSALLGVGSGIFKVLAMDGAMKLPIKVSSATSNFMIGVTAAASAGAYFLRGDIRPEIAAPVSVGIIVGSFLGARAMKYFSAGKIRLLFVVVLALISIEMIWKGLR